MDSRYEIAREKRRIEESARKVEEWVERNEYRGYEPFDGLSSPLRVLTCNNLFLERLFQQAVRQSPVNVRPLLGIRPKDSTKGRGYMAWGYLKRFQLTGNFSYSQKAEECLEWLLENPSPNYTSLSWGNHFDFSSRVGKLPAHEPIIVWTSLIGFALIEAYRTLVNPRYLKAARSVCDWILSLPREHTESGDCLSYVAFEQRSIHNSNMLGAAMLAETARYTKEPELTRVAAKAMEYSCTRQRPDGSWYYGEDSKYHWIDAFHTGYNLDSLKRYIRATGDGSFADNLTRGLDFFIRYFIEDDGCVRYYHERLYPIDIQAVAQTIDTLVYCADTHRECLDLAALVAEWAIEHLQDEDGHFYYRKLPTLTARTPMLHWGQATMFKALTSLLLKLGAADIRKVTATTRSRQKTTPRTATSKGVNHG